MYSHDEDEQDHQARGPLRGEEHGAASGPVGLERQAARLNRETGGGGGTSSQNIAIMARFAYQHRSKVGVYLLLLAILSLQAGGPFLDKTTDRRCYCIETVSLGGGAGQGSGGEGGGAVNLVVDALKKKLLGNDLHGGKTYKRDVDVGFIVHNIHTENREGGKGAANIM